MHETSTYGNIVVLPSSLITLSNLSSQYEHQCPLNSNKIVLKVIRKLEYNKKYFFEQEKKSLKYINVGSSFEVLVDTKAMA